MALTLGEVKNYLRIYHDKDDTIINGLIETAKLHIKTQTGKVYGDGHGLYELLIKMRVHEMYYNRGTTSEKTINKNPYENDLLILISQDEGLTDG